MNSTRPSFFETDRSIQSKAFRRFGVVLPLVLLVAIAAVSAFDLGEAFIFSPPGLILILHTIFLTGIGITVAVVSAKSYLRQGNLSVLILGAAVLTSGFASLIGGYLLSNYGTTIHNISYLVSSAAQVTSALVSLSTIKSSDPSKRKTALTATYLGVAILIIALTAVTFAGFMPVFLTPEGPTLIRQIVVSAIIYLFASSCILFYWRYSESKAESQYWYSLALGLFAIGFLSLTLQIQLADSFGWIGRIAQYSGSIFFLVALLQPTVGVEAIDNLSERWAEAFRRDKRQFDALFSNMVDGFSYQKMIFDEEGKPADFVTLEVNKAYKRLTGLSEREIIGKKATEVYGRMTTELAERIALYGKVALGGEPEKFELYVPRTQKWLAMTVYSVEKGYFAIIREDITERKKLEEEVSSVAKFPSENPYPVLRIGNDGIILYSNNACKSLLGSSFCSIGQLAPENWRQIVTDVLDSGKMKETEETLEDKMFSYSFNPVVESGYVNIYGSDITERKRLEAKNKEYTTQLEELVEDRTEELKLSYNKLNEILESLQEGFYVLDKNWDFVYANKQITSAVGMEPKDWIGQNLWKMFPNYVGTEIEENYRATMEKREVRRFESQSKYSNVWYMVTVFPSIDGIAVLGTDISEHKKLEQQMKDNERLVTIGATAGMVGHDLRNPLQAIVGEIYFARESSASMPEGDDKKVVFESLNAIEERVDYMNKIVTDLQDFVRPIKPDVKEVVTRDLVENTISNIHNKPENVRIQIQSDDSKVMLDPQLVTRVLNNLILNAIQAMPKGGELTVTTYSNKENTTFTVHDTGVGISDDVKPRLFQPLFTTKSQGQGFGLAVCRRVVEAHGGEITFESEVGKGTIFTVRIPNKI